LHPQTSWLTQRSTISVFTFLFNRIRHIVTNLTFAANLGRRFISNLDNFFQLFSLFLLYRFRYNFFFDYLFLVFTHLSRYIRSSVSLLIFNMNISIKIKWFHVWLWGLWLILFTHLNSLRRFNNVCDFLCRNYFLELTLLWYNLVQFILGIWQLEPESIYFFTHLSSRLSLSMRTLGLLDLYWFHFVILESLIHLWLSFHIWIFKRWRGANAHSFRTLKIVLAKLTIHSSLHTLVILLNSYFLDHGSLRLNILELRILIMDASIVWLVSFLTHRSCRMLLLITLRNLATLS